ncbi:MAG TPA: S8 family peptidase [Opitutaceae bacterium]|nr:S8 family peptidase [Opitutaceae bacterium]
MHRSRRLVPVFLSGLLALAASAPEASAQASLAPAASAARAARVREDRVIVRVKAGRDLGLLHRQLGTRGRRLRHREGGRSEVSRFEVVDIALGRREQVIAALQRSGLVDYAEPDYVLEALAEPNDFRFWDGSNWHLRNTGIYGGTPGADIDAMAGWDVRTSAAGVTVAVVDTGIRLTHEDLRPNLWVNPGESGLDSLGRDKRANGVDDDANGFVDDVHGINVLNRTGNPHDDYGHGTHVGGIIGAATNNSVGIAGVAWQVKLMALKFLDYQGHGSISGAIECMQYARDNGAKIVNASWGSYSFTSQALRDCIVDLRTNGILFVAACGNSAGDNDVNPLWPASYEYDNVIAVAATNRTDGKPAFSNWGRTTVDLAAPGSPIYSAWKNSDSDYRYLDGTSMAAPQVAGAAALVWAHCPGLRYDQVKRYILENTEPNAAYANKTVTGGRLNLARILENTPTEPPPPVPTDVIWVEDAVPSGAWLGTSGGDVWEWVTANPAPYSGFKSHRSAVRPGLHDHTFQNATITMPVDAGDTLFVYVYIDPANPPREIMVSWRDTSFEHRAYWGENLINYGTNGTASRRYVGPLPPAGQWVRLEVPAADVGLVNTVVRAMSFTLYDGSVAWDAAGRRTMRSP